MTKNQLINQQKELKSTVGRRKGEKLLRFSLMTDSRGERNQFTKQFKTNETNRRSENVMIK